MTYRNDLDAAHARIDALERENHALEHELERLRMPVVSAPLAMEPIRRAPFDLGHLLAALRVVIFLAVMLAALAHDFAR